MSLISSIWKTISNTFSKGFYLSATIISVIAVIPAFINNQYAVIIALSCFCIVLIGFLISALILVHKILEKSSTKEYENKSTFMKYETLDGNKIIFETYKVIQCKRPVLTEIDYGFKWSGTHLPVITSDLQTVENVIDANDANQYDKAILKFKKPLFYNRNKVIHFKAELDDTDKKSSPHLESKIEQEIDLLHFRVILKHKPKAFSQNAILEKKKIDSNLSVTYSQVRQIHFDKASKTYEYYLLNPDVGYYYRLRWV